MVAVETRRHLSKIKVTKSRAAAGFAACMRKLADVHFPKAERIRVGPRKALAFIVVSIMDHASSSFLSLMRVLKRRCH